MSTHWDALIYSPGTGSALDAWSISPTDRYLFVVTCEAAEWMGWVTRPDGQWYRAYAYPLDATLADIDPAGSFAIDRCQGHLGNEGVAPTPDEIDILNQMKDHIFKHCAHQITTGRTTKLEKP